MELLLNLSNLSLYFNILFIICFSIIFADHIQPWQFIKYKLGLLPDSKSFSAIPTVNIILKAIRKVLYCPSCISMWITFFSLGMNIYSFKLGIIVYCLTYLLNNKINTISL